MHKRARKMIAGLLIAGFALAQPVSAFADAVKIVLDAGHGGSDSGAVGVNGLYEKTVNLDVVMKLKNELTSRGYEVLLTRDQDIFLSLAERVEITDRLKPDLFVSVHANANPNSSITGSQVLYYDKNYPQADYPPSDAMAALTPESKRLAQLVQTNLLQAAGTVDKGVIPSAVYVARMGSVPSVLVETAFLSNPGEAALLSDDGFRRKLAVGIANGIYAYLPAEEPGAFPDVPKSYWANAAIQKLKDKDIVQGGENGRFFPARALTRAEFVVMLERQFQLPDLISGTDTPGCVKPGAGSSTVTGSTYGIPCSSQTAAPLKPKDLPTTHWAYDAMKTALDKGLLGGYPDGTVRPDRSLTRGEAAALIDKVVNPGASQTAAKAIFKDVPQTLWSAAAINRLKEKGIIDGTTATAFEPERPITRAEMAALMARLIP